jgi:hypothetical protein
MTPSYRPGDRWFDAGAYELDGLPLIARAALAVLGLIELWRSRED